MADMLSQEEVNTLLGAFDKGDLQVPEQTIEKNLFTQKKVTIYNFKRPDRVSKEQLRSLELMHEVFSRNLSVSLSGYLRTLIEVHLVSVDQMTYNEFLLSLPNPTCFNICSISPLEGNIIIEINPTIAFPAIDRLLGGDGKSFAEARALTDMEMQMIDGVLSRIVDNLAEVWAEIIRFNFQIEAKDTNPQAGQIVPLSEIVVLLVFEIKIGEISGFLNICIPFLSIESIADKLSLQHRYGSGERQKDNEGTKVKKLVQRVQVPLSVSLGTVNVSVKDLLELRIGDTIDLGKSIDAALEVSISDKHKFFAKPGVVNRKKAIKIVDVYKE
ncbi:MAG: flagellar motor switch protein FliM [Candidatus Omnitrophica bacterium]|nr:flagellar motor switch protein FliM [Candidatus Omnitrophota bacterium]